MSAKKVARGLATGFVFDPFTGATFTVNPTGLCVLCRGENEMRNKPLCVAVRGLNATDNPGPGVGVLRCLRDAPVDYRLIGLAYDALDPGVYATAYADDVS